MSWAATSAMAAVSAAAAIFALLRRTASRLQAENDRLKAEIAEHHFENDRLKAEIAEHHFENDRLKAEIAGHHFENDRLKAEIAEHRSAQAACTNVDLWHPFEEILAVTDHTLKGIDHNNKLVMPSEVFVFGETSAFMNGLPGMLEGGLRRSMAEEAKFNENGKWWEEYRYVAEREAELDVADLPTTAKFFGQCSSSGERIVRDQGHTGLTLAAFCRHEMAVCAGLTPAEVCAIRLYTGPMYEPLVKALRAAQIDDWATTIACCYAGVLKLSFLSQPARVYRGVREDKVKLPAEFLECSEGKFAGGVERAFMSTTKNAAVALDYSGGGATIGSIMVIDFDMNSRGASIQWLSQYPHEEELLFPPCTGLSCLGWSQHGPMRLVHVKAQVSTARLDTRELTQPIDVPGSADAARWVASRLRFSTTEALATAEHLDLSGTSLAAAEHAGRAALVLGRAAAIALPRVRSFSLHHCQLPPQAVVAFCEVLNVNAALTSVWTRAQAPSGSHTAPLWIPHCSLWIPHGSPLTRLGRPGAAGQSLRQQAVRRLA